MSSSGKHIAIFGCGQLAQMTAQAGLQLGHRFSFIADPGEDTRCVDKLGAVVESSPEMPAQELFDALQQPDVISVEKEMVSTSLLSELEQLTQVSPTSKAIHIAQNRIREKTFLREQGIATADFEVIEDSTQLQTLPGRLGLPIYIKAAESGYDGYHQWRIKNVEDLQREPLLKALENNVSLIAEKHVDYRREVSVIAARNTAGDITIYPIMENRHEDGVLLVTQAPASNLDKQIETDVVEGIKKLLLAMNYVGVLTMECFDTADGLVANELAPRVHNSGHWTIEGSKTSQFSNHSRAISDMPLGSVDMEGFAGIVNMLGKHGDAKAFSEDGVFYHDYGKQERTRRKLGHVTVCSDSSKTLLEKLNQSLEKLYGDKYQPSK